MADPFRTKIRQRVRGKGDVGSPADGLKLLASRKRSLTIPLPEPKRSILPFKKDRQKTSEQQQCPLFRLPLELRELIWKFAVGRLFVVMGSIASEPGPGVWTCHRFPLNFPCGWNTPSKGLLNLLLTCRKM
jgi:hypothetical protein